MIKLSNRLSAAADMVREGARLADVGCDHGFVPVKLVLDKKIKSAVACDINEGPLSSCRALVSEYELENKITCVLSNGLDSINGNDIDDVLIAGMGGELIADILSRCKYINEKHLILNSMTHPELAREWLYNNGFEIKRDIIVKDKNHFYSVFDAIYTGNFKQREKADYYLGNIKDFSNKEYFIHLLNYLKNKQKGNEDLSDIILKIEEKL